MRSRISNLLYILLAFLIFVSCEPEINVPAPTSGNADFTRYVAVGNSLTAGFSDDGLYADVQMQSYPMLIAQKMNDIIKSEFRQPDVATTGSGFLTVTSLDLSTDPPAVEFDRVEENTSWTTQLTGPFNNLGVPGIRVKDITVAGYGASPEQGNPYFYRMLGGSPPTTSYLQLVQANRGTFFTSWIGNNDVLGYAASGGIYGVAGQPVTGLGGLTDPDTEFKPSYDALIATLTANGTKGVVVTIPDVTLSPYFTTVKWDDLELDENLATLANGFYASGIDTAIESQVQDVVIEVAVTEQALIDYVVPDAAQGAVFQQTYEVAYQQAIAGGASEQEADSIATATATAYVASPEGQAAISSLEDQLSAEMQNHLLGNHSAHATLEPIYQLIDNELATNTTLQEGIAQGIESTTYGYENDLLPDEQMAALDAAIAAGTQQQIDALKAAGIYPVFKAGRNGFVIFVEQNEANPLGIRQMVEGELVLLTALLDGQLDGLSALEPKPTQYILTGSELGNVNSYTDQYNQIIRSYASSPDIALFESNDVLQEVADGIFEDGVSVNGDFLTGGAFSLDGVHLTPRGYAIVANSIIDVINSSFNARLSPVIINNHRAVILP